jgi:hypothetical protein
LEICYRETDELSEVLPKNNFWQMKVKLYLCITTVLNGVQGSLLGPGHFNPEAETSGVLGIGHSPHLVFVLCKIIPILIRREYQMSSLWPFIVLTEIVGSYLPGVM